MGVTMRQANFRRFYLFSVSREGLNTNENHKRTIEAINLCDDMGLNYAMVAGKYKGTKEVSFMVFDEANLFRSEIEAICKLYNQESFIIRDVDNYGYLVDCISGEQIELGRAIRIDSKEANKLENVSMVRDAQGVNNFFTFKLDA